MLLLPTREVVHGDALPWLAEHPSAPACSILASMPDVAELGLPLDRWAEFFAEAARLALLATPPEGLTIFYQTDGKLDGRWVSKATLVLGAAASLGVPVLWHKIVCRHPPGKMLTGRPGFSHLIAFSRLGHVPANSSTPDVLPDQGTMTWSHSMGTRAAEEAMRAIRVAAPTTQTVIVPFCGIGTALAVANDFGFHAIGIERNKKRATRALSFQLEPEAA